MSFLKCVEMLHKRETQNHERHEERPASLKADRNESVFLDKNLVLTYNPSLRLQSCCTWTVGATCKNQSSNSNADFQDTKCHMPFRQQLASGIHVRGCLSLQREFPRRTCILLHMPLAHFILLSDDLRRSSTKTR